jgi:hypothetical protein
MKNKQLLTDLFSEVQELNKKYLIDDFSQEIKTLFADADITMENMEDIIRNPFAALESNSVNQITTIPNDVFEKYISSYKSLKKKYNYEEYIKEGHALRKKFLNERKSYIFNNAKFVQFTKVKKTTTLEKLNFDYAEQYFIAKWIDKLLKKIYPKTLAMEYEDLYGNMQKAEIAHHKIEITDDYVQAPLIDRFVGESLFDSFLLHSFYNINIDAYQYVPVKFIVNLRSKDYPSTIPFE